MVYTEGAGEDPTYRPRRPTCDVGVQVSIPVDAGVQCDPPATEHPYGYWPPHPQPMGMAPGTAQPPGQPAAYPYGLPYNSSPYGMVPPMTPFPGYWGGGLPPALDPSMGHMPGTVPAALARQLYAAAVSGGRGFGLRPREAWGSPGPAAGYPGGRASGLGATSSSGAGLTGQQPTPATAIGGPAQLAMDFVDESFRQQVDMLRQALARHRAVLEHQRGPTSSGSASGPLSATGRLFESPAVESD